MKRLFTLLTVAWTVAVAASAHATASDVPAHLGWARRLVTELTPDRNAYASHPTYVVWDEDGTGPARNRSVCSSFVSRDLERAYGVGPAKRMALFGTANPQAKDYYATIAAERGFERISHVGDLRPGDIVGVRYPDGSRPTGHVMILSGSPRSRPATAPVVSATTQYDVEVIDSSHSFHGSHDTRYRGKDAPGGGVGRGIFRLYANADGTIAGYAWSTRRVSTYYDTNARRLVVGRFEPTYAGPTASPIGSNDDDANEKPDIDE